ncbi:MAG: DeoR/GlpR family DNA-binding transcription regulator [Anaerolineaceae bacterium]|jgi:DeoR family fructose operon transcriptional repressor|nr:DeoR/GlpR family DNA-binding transcription regulator [Anaerolineaceae bacterium]
MDQINSPDDDFQSKITRQEEILACFSQDGIISISSLSAQFGVSEITIRRDLLDLERKGKIERVRGGARIARSHSYEPPVVHRQMEQVAEKEAIALGARDLIRDGETIALESGSTAQALAKAISQKKWQQLQVVTNSLLTVNLLISVPGIQTTFIGGFVDPNEMCTYGKLAEEVLGRLHVDKYFCGCRGITPSFGRSNEIQTGIEVGTVKAFAKAAGQIIVLADHTKFGKTFSLQLLDISEIDTIITTDQAPREMLEEIQRLGVHILGSSLENEFPG